MSTTDTNVQQVIVNKLTSAEYATATKEPTEFYMVTDEQIETSDIADGAVTTAKIADGAVTSEKIDFTTFKYQNATPVLIGKFTDQNNVKHNLYRRYYQIAGWGGIASGNYNSKTLGLQNYTIINFNFVLYRPTLSVYNSMGQNYDAVFVEGGRTLRLYNQSGQTLAGDETLYGYVEYID